MRIASPSRSVPSSSAVMALSGTAARSFMTGEAAVCGVAVA
ncbi:MAG: hypothetical protein M5U09_07890 [Gammaproteobacteria bacterium]|nr:hypothetical protein [Gammaproteobacteria bacterium]